MQTWLKPFARVKGPSCVAIFLTFREQHAGWNMFPVEVAARGSLFDPGTSCCGRGEFQLYHICFFVMGGRKGGAGLKYLALDTQDFLGQGWHLLFPWGMSVSETICLFW